MALNVFVDDVMLIITGEGGRGQIAKLSLCNLAITSQSSPNVACYKYRGVVITTQAGFSS